MKIGLIIYGSLDTISGGYLYDRKLVEYLCAQGDSVEIISLPWTRYGRHLTHNLSSQLLTQLQNADFDILLQDELNHASLFWLNKQLHGKVPYPIISIVHHLRISENHQALHKYFYYQIEKAYLQSVDGFIFNSQTTQQVVENIINNGCGRSPDQAAGRHGEDAGHSKSSTKPHAIAYPAGDRFQQTISPTEIKARANKREPLQILFVGNLIARKGLHTLLDALAILPKSDWQLHIVGNTKVDINYKRHIERQIETAVLQQNITFHHTLTDDELAQQMAQSHILVMPSQYEGFGIVYLEGMGFGLPAIGSTNGAAWEMIRDGENGFLVDVGNTAILAQKIQQLQQNREQLTQMSLNARQTFQAWPSWKDTTKAIREFLYAHTQKP